MQRILIRWSLIVWCSVALSNTPALGAPFDLRQYAHTAWTLSTNGLQGYPRTVAQTADGYLWLGTDFGLLRFDGARFASWSLPSGQSLPSQTVVSLLAGRNGALWIGTAQGLARWHAGALTSYPEVGGQYIAALLEDRDGTVWAGTSAGLGRSARLCAIERSAGVACHGDDGSLGRFVISLHQDSRGTLRAGTATGLWLLRGGRLAPQPLARAAPEIHAIAEHADGSILLATNREIARVLGAGSTPLALPADAAQLRPTALHRDRDGGLWIGTQDRGVWHLRNGQADHFTRKGGLSGDLVTSIFEDREGNIWVGTLNGLDRFRRLPISSLSTEHGLSSNQVMSVLSSPDGSVWIATTDGLNRWRDQKVTVYTTRDGLPDDVMASLFLDSQQRLWISSTRGLAYLQHEAVRVVPGVPGGFIHAIAEDRTATLWLSDQDRGLLRVRNGTLLDVVPWSVLGGRRVRALAADPTRNGIWLGFFEGGIAYLEDGRLRQSYGLDDGLDSGAVTQLRFDRSGALWVAGTAGLSRVLNGRVMTLTRQNGLPCDTVYSAIEDAHATLWLRTACGLVRIDSAAIAAWTTAAARPPLKVYNESDGVPSLADVGSYGPKLTLSPDGRVWFATYDGVGVIDPDSLPFNTVPPPVHLEQVLVDRTPFAATAPLRLPPLVRDIRIDYTALSLVAPEKIRFRYRLEGRDDDWVDAGNRRQAFFTDLPPSTYRFRVIAANNDGVWNDTGAAMAFEILPAFYQAMWFRALVLAGFTVALWALYKLRVRMVARQLHLRFEERLAERTRIAQDIHDTLLQGFTSTSMQLHVLADRVTDDSARRQFDRILGLVGQVLEEGRQAVQGLRSRPDPVEHLEDILGRDAERFRGSQRIDLRVITEGRRQPLHPIIRDEVYRISREALANAFGHAEAGRVDVEIEYGATRLQVVIRDDGCGMEPPLTDASGGGHWGIIGMRERAGRIGAEFGVWSRRGSGTEVEVSVPAKIAYAALDSDAAADDALPGTGGARRRAVRFLKDMLPAVLHRK